MNTKMVYTKITLDHLRRQALVYIRQSTTQQVRSNHESVERQYALVERAVALGWTPEATHTIDEDQGRSGTSALHRPGFKKLLAEISAGQVGIVLALEASRLARSSVDWHRLVEICGITRTLLADDGAVYDPREPNDRLLLGVKGTLSEAELFTLRCRLHEGRWNKARRGALSRSLPVGYVCGEEGRPGNRYRRGHAFLGSHSAGCPFCARSGHRRQCPGARPPLYGGHHGCPHGTSWRGGGTGSRQTAPMRCKQERPRAGTRAILRAAAVGFSLCPWSVSARRHHRRTGRRHRCPHRSDYGACAQWPTELALSTPRGHGGGHPTLGWGV
jgi:DNA invertase Pin-like site-specific DNA recombinase